MGSRALYQITENGLTTSYYSHWGANILTPPWRLLQAEELIAQEHPNMTVSEMFKHVGYKGRYTTAGDGDTDNRPVFEEINPKDAKRMYKDLCSGYDIEAYIKLNLDSNSFEYHENPRMAYTNRQTRSVTGRLDALKHYAKKLIDDSPEDTPFSTVETKLLNTIVNEPRSLRNFESLKNKECCERYIYLPEEQAVEMMKMVYTPNSTDTLANIVTCKISLQDIVQFYVGESHEYTEFERKCLYGATERYITPCQTARELYDEFCYSAADFTRLSNIDTDQKELCDYIERSFCGDRCFGSLHKKLEPIVSEIDRLGDNQQHISIKISEYTKYDKMTAFKIPEYDNYYGFYQHDGQRYILIIAQSEQNDIDTATRNNLSLDFSQEADKIVVSRFNDEQRTPSDILSEALSIFVEEQQEAEKIKPKRVVSVEVGDNIAISDTNIYSDSYAGDISEAVKLLNTGNGVKLGQLNLGDELSDTLALVNLADAGQQRKPILFINKGEDIGLSGEQVSKIHTAVTNAAPARTQTQTQQQSSRRRR